VTQVEGGAMNKLYMFTLMAVILFCIPGCQDKAAIAELEAFRAKAEIEEQNEALIVRFNEELNKGNTGIFEQLLATDYRYYFPSGAAKPLSREEHSGFFLVVNKAFPDANRRIDEIYAVGDRVISRITFTATHQGEYQGIPATGNSVEFSDIAIYRIENGQIAELRDELDMLSIMTQLGRELEPIGEPEAGERK